MAELYENKPRRISPYVGIVGTHGAGKTTLARSIAGRVDAQFVPSPARRIGAELGHSENATLLGQSLIAISVFNGLSKPYGGIYDRTPVDVLAYTLYAIGINEIGAREGLPELIRFAEVGMAMFDRVFYLPAYRPPANDGHRSVDVDYQRAIQKQMLVLLDDFKTSYVTIPDGTVEEQTDFIQSNVAWYNRFST